jgi:ATP phosphoribosyltransferase regulatory subunit
LNTLPDYTGLPRGVADYLPARAATIAAIEGQLLQVAGQWGFQRIMPPALEFEEVLASGMGEGLRSRTFRFDDWQSGRMLAIPPDITPQIARIVATRLRGRPLPHRICYSGRVLRHAELQSGRSREIFQAGVELIGLDSPEADAEMVAMAVELMQGLGIAEFTVDLGQVAFCRGVFEASGLTGEPLQQMQAAVARKDASAVAALLAVHPVPEQSRQELLALPRLFGGREVLEDALRVVKNEVSCRALHNLHEVVAILELHGVTRYLTIDLGETRGLDYHTGLTFEGFAPGVGEALFSGGRYDDLTARYGLPAPATGFTCNVLPLVQALEATAAGCGGEPRRDLLLFNQRADRQEALTIARALRGQGFSVARDIIRRDFESSLAYARATGIRCMLVIDQPEVGCLLVRSSDGKQTKITREQLLQDGFLHQHDLFQE